MLFLARAVPAGKPVSPPTCFALISTFSNDDPDRYIHTLHADMEDTAKFGELYAGDYDVAAGGGILTNPQARFYFEPSKKNEGYQHIRCGYNNKYWVAEKPTEYPDAKYMAIGTTPQREEDMSKPLCTLFKVDLRPKDRKDDAGNNVYDASFYDAHGRKAFISATDRVNRDLGLSGYLHEVFLVRDLSDHVVLPRHVAFKGDIGKYLTLRTAKGRPFMQFAADDIADPAVMHTTFHNDNGTVRIKSNQQDRFLRYSPAWIWADGRDQDGEDEDAPIDRDTLFKVVKIDDYYGLWCISAAKFCKRLTADIYTDCLNACIDHVTTEAKIWVEEAVLSRQIYNVVYHGLDKARIYDTKTINMATSSAVNRTSENNNVKLSLTITQAQTSTWDASVSVKAGVKTTITAGVPEVLSGSAEYSLEITGEYSWGATEVNETKQEVIYEMVVPKMKKVTVSAIATRAKCDVPFSYTQKDVMPSGEVIITTHHDGMYRGMNTFNLQYETKEEAVPAAEIEDDKEGDTPSEIVKRRGR